MAEPEFPDSGILWRGWNEETLDLIDQRRVPVLLFVADPDPLVRPFLIDIFKQLPKHAKLRELLHAFFPGLFLKIDELPEQLKVLGAGRDFHIAVLSPSGLTPLITFEVTSRPALETVNNIAAVLERLRDVWC